MTEYVSLKTKNLLEVWEETECEEVVSILEGLYPDVLPPKEEEKKERDVTDEIRFEKCQDFFRIMHGEDKVTIQKNASSVSPSGKLTIEFNAPRSGYRFEVTSNQNWKVIKEDE